MQILRFLGGFVRVYFSCVFLFFLCLFVIFLGCRFNSTRNFSLANGATILENGTITQNVNSLMTG